MRIGTCNPSDQVKKDDPYYGPNAHGPFEPVTVEDHDDDLSWWGRCWNKNLMRWADMSDRLQRGEEYCRKGKVLHLKIQPLRIIGIVQGSKNNSYSVNVDVSPVSKDKITGILKRMTKKISSVESLLSGSFPDDMKKSFFDEKHGLFPEWLEMSFNCMCPDQHYNTRLCKHVAAVLYGAGLRLDHAPDLFFSLRGIPLNVLAQSAVKRIIETLLYDKTIHSDRILTLADIDRNSLKAMGL